MLKITLVYILILLLFVTPLAAAFRVNDFEIVLFGRVWQVTSYNVQDDLLENQNEDVFLDPEGLAFRSGLLYVSGDSGLDETDSRLAVYDYSEGVLSFDTYIQMTDWGPEGLTFNNSGNGLGSDSNELVSVEYDATSQLGIIDLNTSDVVNQTVFSSAEDITFVPGRGNFAVLEDVGTTLELKYYDVTMIPVGESFPVASGSNGIDCVDQAFGSWFTRTNISGEMFVLVSNANPGNCIIVYDEYANQIGHAQDLPVTPQAMIPLGGGFYLVEPAFGAIEAIVIDQVNRIVFIGDEENSMIHSVLSAGVKKIIF